MARIWGKACLIQENSYKILGHRTKVSIRNLCVKSSEWDPKIFTKKSYFTFEKGNYVFHWIMQPIYFSFEINNNKLLHDPIVVETLQKWTTHNDNNNNNNNNVYLYSAQHTFTKCSMRSMIMMIMNKHTKLFHGGRQCILDEISFVWN